MCCLPIAQRIRTSQLADASRAEGDAALADDLFGLHELEGVLVALHGVLGAHIGLQLPLGGHVDQIRHHLPAQLGLEADLSAHPHADQVETFDEGHVDRQLRNGSPGEAHDQQACVPSSGNTPDTLVENVTTDRLVDDITVSSVGDLSDCILQLFLAVVDDEVRSDLFADLQFLVRTGRRDDLGPQRLAQFHGHEAHAAPRASDQEPLTGFQLPPVHQRVVACGVAHVEASALAEREPGRKCDAHRLWQHNLLGSTTHHRRKQDRIPDFVVLHTLCDLPNNTRTLSAQHER
mmetsp:Transcript_64560/g.185680  ORF Transcript_64560/g.185680 Transcript_64560/m.185680 type:complete len:291 (+) Transcript_64560:16-888(+)